MHYKVILFDVDDTLLDFQAAEKQALTYAFTTQDISVTEELIAYYHQMNRDVWKIIEKENDRREEMLVERFKRTLTYFAIKADPSLLNQAFRTHLASEHQLLGNSLAVVRKLYDEGYTLQVASNSRGVTQRKRLKAAGLIDYFDQIFVSDEVGAQKPAKKFFDTIFYANRDIPKDKLVIVGDSYTSDITGGIKNGIDTIWLSIETLANDQAKPTYQIATLDELPVLLNELESSHNFKKLQAFF